MFVQELVKSDDIITIQDLKKETGFPILLNIEQQNLSKATAKMTDNIDGKQVWVGKVIGIAEDYIHFFDGSRKWIHVGDNINRIEQHDSILIEVEKYGEENKLEKIITLSNKIHFDN